MIQLLHLTASKEMNYKEITDFLQLSIHSFLCSMYLKVTFVEMHLGTCNSTGVTTLKQTRFGNQDFCTEALTL